MFIKVAGRAFEPTAMIMFRLLIAAALLLVFLTAQRGWRRTLAEMRRLGWEGFALGVVNAAIPFTLIAWGEKHIDSGVAAIANASMPIFVVLLAIRWKPSERVRGLRLAGFLIGLIGVGVLAGVHPEGGWWGVAGTLAVVLASASYAAGSLWSQRLVERTSGLISQIILYRALRSDGAARVSLVTYLLPVTALFYGLMLLGEPLTWQELAGMVLILGGVALGSGAVRLPRREPVAAPAP